MKLKSLLFTGLTVAVTHLLPAHAYDNLKTTVNALGCHVNSDMCYVYVDASSIPNAEKCSSSTSIRWSSETFKNSDEVFSILLAAKLSGAEVTFGNVGGVCYEGFVSFSFLTVN
jgi:hypothetical protein